MREIVTLQFGQRSNYLATHFWNFQESYFTYSESEESLVDHDVHFRAGIGVEGSETYTPRTVIYDLKGGFGSLRKYNALYEISTDNSAPDPLWQGKTATQKQAVIEPSTYQKNLDQGLATFQLTADQVRYWSDFNRVYYHPKSIVQLNEYELNSQLMPFENWHAGKDLFKDLDKEFDLFDRDVRPFAEECDHLSGIQIFTSTDDAWGGFSSSYADILRDEFPKASIWVWGLEDALRASRQTEIRRSANVARSLQSIEPQVSAYIRLTSPPTILPGDPRLDLSSEWSKSSILCTAIETATLPSRLREGSGRTRSLAGLESDLNKTGSRRLFELRAIVVRLEGSKIPSPKSQGAVSSTSATRLVLNYSPRGSQKTLGRTPHVFSQVEVRRCLSGEHLPIDSSALVEQDTNTEIYATALPFPRLDSFPNEVFGTFERSIGIHAALATTSETQTRLKDMSHLINRAIGVDDREALLNDLAVLGEAYQEGWQSTSESDPAESS